MSVKNRGFAYFAARFAKLILLRRIISPYEHKIVYDICTVCACSVDALGNLRLFLSIGHHCDYF